MDPGQDETEELIKKIEKNVIAFYSEAKKDVEAKMKDYMRRHATKDKIKRKQLAAGEITQEEYNEWLKGQIMAGNRWQQQLDVISTDLLNAHNLAKSMVNGYMPEAYAMGHNYGTYQIEHGSSLGTSYTLYDRQTVERLIRDDPELLPALKPMSRTAQEIADGKIKAWSREQIHNTCLQGILQGESIPAIATRISDITTQQAQSTIRYARTMTTGAENAGRVDSYHRAESMGIEMEQQWLATLDNRTRESHRQMDGEHVPVGKLFSNGCEYPGDPNGPAEEIWNCRCTLVAMLTGIPELDDINDTSNLLNRNTNNMTEATYEEWKAGKMESISITHQKDVGEAIKNQTINAYIQASKRLKDVEVD